MNQSTKLLLAFGGSALVGNLVGRAIVAGSPPSTNSPLLFQVGTAAVTVAGGAIAYSLRNDTFSQSKDVAMMAAMTAGLFGGAGAATIGMETTENTALPGAQQVRSLPGGQQ